MYLAPRSRGGAPGHTGAGQNVALASKVLKSIPFVISFWWLWDTLFRLTPPAAATATTEPPAQLKYKPYASNKQDTR